jgi:membrane protease YdiL (CAAX protease family)
MLVTFVLGVLSVVTGQPELGATLVIGLVLATVHAADLVPGWGFFARSMEGVVQLAGILILVVFAGPILNPLAGEHGFVRPLQGFLLAMAAVLAVTLPPRAGDALARVLMGARTRSYVLSLTARLALVTLAVCVPFWFVFQRLPDLMGIEGQDLFGTGQLVATLLGYNLLALAGVGWLVRRDFKGSLARLGVGPLRLRQWGWVALGTAGLFVLSNGGEWLQRTYFPDLYAADKRFDELLAGAVSPAGALLLGITAGVGEELTLRGALQPKLGIVLTALLFAAMHVQYSLVGIAFIFLFGLALGGLRARTSTTVSILVHALYDVLVLFALRWERSGVV